MKNNFLDKVCPPLTSDEIAQLMHEFAEPDGFVKTLQSLTMSQTGYWTDEDTQDAKQLWEECMVIPYRVE